MSDNDGADPQAGADTKPQAGADDSTPKAQAAQTLDGLPKWAQDLIRDTRKEAGDYRTKLNKIEDANKSELQKAIDKAAELEKQYGDVLTEVQQERAERLVLTAATKANAVRPDAVFRLVRDGLEYEDGKPTNVDAVVKAARTEYPELFRASAGTGDGGKTGETKQDPNALLNNFIRTGR